MTNLCPAGLIGPDLLLGLVVVHMRTEHKPVQNPPGHRNHQQTLSVVHFLSEQSSSQLFAATCWTPTIQTSEEFKDLKNNPTLIKVPLTPPAEVPVVMNRRATGDGAHGKRSLIVLSAP